MPLNATVGARDRLEIALVTQSTTPLCTLVKNSSEIMFDINTSTRTPFANGPGQVSFRGNDGKTPPVVILPGQEIKWYAIVN